MTRIIGGVARGRTLVVPPGSGTRPTSDRAREALFSSLSAMVGPFAGLRVLDLYAGSGAVGLEGLSRGAAHALLVEDGTAAVRAVRANMAALGLLGAELRAAQVERALVRPPSAPYDLVFADPPYGLAEPELTRMLTALVAHGWLSAAAVVVVERGTRGEPPAWPDGLVGDRSRPYGEATLWYGHAAVPPVATPP